MQETMSEGEWRGRSDAAQVVANFLRCHPKVSEVRYPGLTSDAAYREASSTLRGGFGPLVWLLPSGAAAEADDGWLVFEASEADAREQVLELERFLTTR